MRGAAYVYQLALGNLEMQRPLLISRALALGSCAKGLIANIYLQRLMGKELYIGGLLPGRSSPFGRGFHIGVRYKCSLTDSLPGPQKQVSL